MNYYEHHLGDWIRCTVHLSLLEEGAYRRLIDQYYIRELPLPAAKAEIYRLVRATSRSERAAVDTVLREFFKLTDQGYQHSRGDREIARFRDKREKAKRSADARWSACERNANAMRTHSEGICDGNALQSPVTSHQTPEGRTLRSSSVGDLSPSSSSTGPDDLKSRGEKKAELDRKVNGALKAMPK